MNLLITHLFLIDYFFINSHDARPAEQVIRPGGCPKGTFVDAKRQNSETVTQYTH